MEFDINTLAAAGISVETGEGYTGGGDKYISALRRFYRASGDNRAKMAEYMEKGDAQSFSITVHTLKSNSKMIGAMELSAMFERMERSSKEGDLVSVGEDMEKTLAEYGRILEVIRPIGEMEDFKAAGEISGEEAKKVARELLEALDDFDDDTSMALAGKLSGYPFRITHREKLKEATEYISQFMYEEAAGLIREIVSHIE